MLDDLRRLQYDNATVKVDWAVSGPVPWQAEAARRAGTVHLAESVDALTWYDAQLVEQAWPDPRHRGLLDWPFRPLEAWRRLLDEDEFDVEELMEDNELVVRAALPGVDPECGR